jgi:hypothetical protein
LLTPQSLTLTLFDEAGWLTSTRCLDPDLVSRILAKAGFDLVMADEAEHCLRLVKRFEAP